MIWACLHHKPGRDRSLPLIREPGHEAPRGDIPSTAKTDHGQDALPKPAKAVGKHGSHRRRVLRETNRSLPAAPLYTPVAADLVGTPRSNPLADPDSCSSPSSTSGPSTNCSINLTN